MKRKTDVVLKICLVMTALLFMTILAYGNPSQPIPALVSTEWLAANSSLENLILIDVRTNTEYAAGHIAGAINVPFEVPFSAWITMRNDLLFEVPETQELFNTLGSLGITCHSSVVVITSGTANPPYPLANATWAADILLYTGVKNAAILDGGFNLWAAEGKPVTAAVPSITPVTFRGWVDTRMFVTREYVKAKITHKSRRPFVLIDARDAEVYSGAVIDPYAPKAGHIPTAKSLPTVSLWTEDGKYKPVPELAQLAAKVAGEARGTEIVVYCSVGGYASTLYYVLSELLGYNNVRIYEGSTQEWVIYDDMVLD